MVAELMADICFRYTLGLYSKLEAEEIGIELQVCWEAAIQSVKTWFSFNLVGPRGLEYSISV